MHTPSLSADLEDAGELRLEVGEALALVADEPLEPLLRLFELQERRVHVLPLLVLVLQARQPLLVLVAPGRLLKTQGSRRLSQTAVKTVRPQAINRGLMIQ